MTDTFSALILLPLYSRLFFFFFFFFFFGGGGGGVVFGAVLSGNQQLLDIKMNEQWILEYGRESLPNVLVNFKVVSHGNVLKET